MKRGVVLFPTTTSALRAEKILQKAGLSVALIPTPRELSSDCGLALHFDPTDLAHVEQHLNATKVEYEIHVLG